MSDAAYPPEPWFLAGQMLVSTFLVEPGDIPGLKAALPDGHRPVLVSGRAVVGVASVTYEAPGMLEYDELLVGVLTHARGALRVTIPQIWVSTEQSAAGGRELWAIPKHVATFTPDGALLAAPGSGPGGSRVAAPVPERDPHRRGVSAQVRLPDGAPILRLAAHLGARLLPRLPLTLTTAQRALADHAGSGVGSITSRNRVHADVRCVRVRWDVARPGPLAWLAGHRPLLSLALTDAVITFGRDVRR